MLEGAELLGAERALGLAVGNGAGAGAEGQRQRLRPGQRSYKSIIAKTRSWL